MTHLMLDVETLSTRNNAVVISLGAVVFDDEIRAVYSAVVSDPDKQADLGAHVQPSTALWWMQQSDEARNQFKSASMDTHNLLISLSQLYVQNKISEVWSNPSNFDIVILENLYNLFKVPVPWTYRNTNCLKTLTKRFPNVIRDTPKVKHCAVSDAIAQANTCMRILRNIT